MALMASWGRTWGRLVEDDQVELQVVGVEVGADRQRAHHQAGLEPEEQAWGLGEELPQRQGPRPLAEPMGVGGLNDAQAASSGTGPGRGRSRWRPRHRLERGQRRTPGSRPAWGSRPPRGGGRLPPVIFGASPDRADGPDAGG